MGQYYKLVNITKKEVVNPWDLGGVAKFWEWFWGKHQKVLVWLLAKSSGDGHSEYERQGGGDIENKGYETLGRWAGDKVVLVGDYDGSKLFEKSEKYRDISKEVAVEINKALLDNFKDDPAIKDELLIKDW